MLATGAGSTVIQTGWPLAVAANDSTPGNPANTTVNFNADGTISYSALPNDGSSAPPRWATGSGGGFWMRVTATSGTFTAGTTGTWQQMNANRSYTKNSTSGNNSVVYTVEFATDSGGTTIVGTFTGNTQVSNHV